MTRTVKIKSSQREAQLAFDALSIEGGLLSPDWLSRAAQLKASAQSPQDYRVDKGLSLRDEIGRFWRIAQSRWHEFALGKSSKADPKALTERFVIELLKRAFEFESLVSVETQVLRDHSYPIGHWALGGRVPVVIAPCVMGANARKESGLEVLSASFGDLGRKRTAFGLAQEYLNAADTALWGIASDGDTLRILRDNLSLTRPAWIEADLARIFTEQRYADFAALWLILHESRFGKSPTQSTLTTVVTDGDTDSTKQLEGAVRVATDCALEDWRTAGREEGTRAREHLRVGVEEALLDLGNGFLLHPDNQALRESFHSGALSTREYFGQLLRLVYRLIFLITVEERELLHPEHTSASAKKLYRDGYSMQRLRERSIKRAAHDRYSDLWEAVKIVFRGLAVGEERLGLPALAGIFARSECAAIDGAKIENHRLLSAVFRLCWLRENTGLARVNWRDMGPEELGSVYESLLELVPQVVKGQREFTFATGNETKGNARKTSGSYYTPDSLVQVLLDSALEPVIAQTIAANPTQPAQALLQLAIVDPACGSGHFLLAAARRLAAHVARIQSNGTPSAKEYRHALRQVVAQCIYGVDLNPMAVELCKVSLWMEAVEPGLPLTFLNSHIQHGNSLIGATPELMAKGIPDAAWEPIEGDDKKIASALKKRNKEGQKGQRALDTLFALPANEDQHLTQAIVALDAASDADLASLTNKESKWVEILESEPFRAQQLIADTWCAAFVWPKQPGPLVDAAPTSEVWWQLRNRPKNASPMTVKKTAELAKQYQFFHWHLAFPQVFARGGFDVVLGNPPWERVKLQELEFFATRSATIFAASNADARKKLIAKLQHDEPALWDEWVFASRAAEGQSHFARQSARFPLCGAGDVNTYTLFAEHNRWLHGSRGRAGFIIPSGIATDDTTKEFFASLIEGKNLVSLLDFQSSPGLFGEIGHARFKFSLITLGQNASAVDMLFFARDVAELSDPNRHFTLSDDDFGLLNPNTRTCPTFRSRRDADLNRKIYRTAGVLWRDDDPEGNPWNLRFLRMLDMASDSGLFRSAKELAVVATQRGNRWFASDTEHVPLLEAKMVHQFDHRYGDYADKPSDSENTSLPDVPVARLDNPHYAPQPRYWVDSREVDAKLKDRWNHQWLLGWRDICRSTDERTVIAAVIPAVAVNDKFLLILPGVETALVAPFLSNMCSFPLDYCARQKVGGTSLKYFTMRQLPVLPPQIYAGTTPWTGPESLLNWLSRRVLELTYTSWDLESFANDVGHNGPPFRWNPERRALLRCELDAAFFHLYGLSREEADYIMDTFPIVRRHDEKEHGEYRTKRVILEIYDAIERAIRTGIPYQTRLDPPPADPRVAHPAKSKRE
jgi:hypothetical protein